jgi:cephalosporin hydroxylase
MEIAAAVRRRAKALAAKRAFSRGGNNTMRAVFLRTLRSLYPHYQRILRRPVSRLFFMDLIGKTDNFGDVTWMGHPVWQNVLDLWTIQETIVEVKPALLIECGTNRGGSAMFYGDLLDLMGDGRLISIDIQKMHDRSHPRVTFLIGSSTAPDIVEQVGSAAREVHGPVMVILDSDHSAAHVAGELEAYASLVTPGSYLLVQDGVIDVLPTLRADRPGPLPAIRAFLGQHPEFEMDTARTERFLITHHPMGWLRRR